MRAVRPHSHALSRTVVRNAKGATKSVAKAVAMPVDYRPVFVDAVARRHS